MRKLRFTGPAFGFRSSRAGRLGVPCRVPREAARVAQVNFEGNSQRRAGSLAPGIETLFSEKIALGILAASRFGLGRARSLPQKFFRKRPRRGGPPPEPGKSARPKPKNFCAFQKARPRLNGRNLGRGPRRSPGLQASQFADNAGARPPRGQNSPAELQARRERPQGSMLSLIWTLEWTPSFCGFSSGARALRRNLASSALSKNWSQ